MNQVDYAQKAKEMRKMILSTLYYAGGSFSGGALSCTDILAVLFHGFIRFDTYNPEDPKRDIFLLSKGHCSSALYAGLVSVGLMPKELLQSYGADGSILSVHPHRGSWPGVEASTGSLGHGLALGVGSALAARILNCDSRVFVLMGDGECNEGSVWESAAFASKQKLASLTVIIDRNGLQGCGRDSEVLNYGDLGEKFGAFGFHVVEVDGHSYKQLHDAFQSTTEQYERPTAVIAHTIKGKGISFMEDKLEWHYKSLSEQQYARAMEELA